MKPVTIAAGLAALCAMAGAAAAQSCDAECLEGIAAQYRAAYDAHDPAMAPFAAEVRYSENNVLMPFPEGTWNTVTEDLGPVQYFSDPVTGNAMFYTAMKQDAVEGFLAVRIHVNGDGRIDEAEHIISTARNLSSPPTPIGKVADYEHAPFVNDIVPEGERATREALIAHAHGYFNTLQHNNGEIRGTCFLPDATRRENGMVFGDIGGGFESGRYGFNDRVRRNIVMVDERRQVSVGRGFIDHQGVLNEYELTDGEIVNSVYQEPQSWGLLESFVIRDGCIAAVLAAFYQAPYYQSTPWGDELTVGPTTSR